MGSCCSKSSASKEIQETAANTATAASFPVVINNPVSTGGASSPSTCSSVSTTSSDGSDNEDESKADNTGMLPQVARSVIARMIATWKKRRVADTRVDSSTPQPSAARAHTPRPQLANCTRDTANGSDSDPWDIVEGDL